MSLHTTWSVRACFERADALADQLAGLRQFISGGPLLESIAILVDQQRELIVHLARNLRGGMALPPTPAQSAHARRNMPPVVHLKQRPLNAVPTRRRPSVSRASRPPGLLDARAAQALTGYSSAGFYAARQEGRIPAPHTMHGRSPLWHPDQLAGIRKTPDGVRPRGGNV